jgi:hypothetical protein
VVAKVGYITRHNLYSLGLSDAENYKQTVCWMNEHHDNFDESYYSNLITDGVKRAHKNPFYRIESIKITQSELNSIASLGNLRAEKVLFVLLCMAKQQRAIYGFTNGLVRYSLPELCKTARISVPADDREYILYDIVQKGLLGCPKKNDTKCLIVNFINEDDEIVMQLDEIDCQELAYAYLNWKNNGVGYGRCEYCNKLMKKTKKNPHRFCEACTQIVGDVADNMKVITCVDCGEVFYVDKRNNTKCRCDTCQTHRDKEMTRLRVQKHRTLSNM